MQGMTNAENTLPVFSYNYYIITYYITGNNAYLMFVILLPGRLNWSNEQSSLCSETKRCSKLWKHV